ncbi:MAG: Ferredoxin-dependent glutamate synthase 1 [Syntrophomonadaceae bacterium]|nr:Ferredoxin-dependent glutamate synthase 1 [Bacillota bacterium]
MAKRPIPTEFIVERNDEKCIACQACVRMCANDVHSYDPETDTVSSDSSKCVGCHFCESICPTGAITIRRNPSEFKVNANWNAEVIRNITKQTETGGVLLTGIGCDKPYPIYWDHILLNASQVTNPSIDPLREPMELRTYIGRKPDKADIDCSGNKKKLKTKLSPLLQLETPILFSAMSYGSISLNACKSLARAAAEVGTFYNTGEGGLHKELYKYSDNTIVQVASGRFGVHKC